MVELLVAVDDPVLLDDPAWGVQFDALVQVVRRWSRPQRRTDALVAPPGWPAGPRAVSCHQIR